MYFNEGQLSDSLMIDNLSCYVSISEFTLDKLYEKASVVLFGNKEVFSCKNYFGCHLYRFFPALEKTLSYVHLADLPTPVRGLKKVGEKIGCKNLYIKRDDLSGEKVAGKNYRFFGGNKVRTLEFLLGQAISHGCKTVMTIGSAGSNHALATAVCAHKVGLKSVSILMSQEKNDIVQRNILLGKYYGAQLHHFNEWDESVSGIAQQIFNLKEKEVIFSYNIPFGGSCSIRKQSRCLY